MARDLNHSESNLMLYLNDILIWNAKCDRIWAKVAARLIKWSLKKKKKNTNEGWRVFVAPEKSKLKIENNVKKVKKVLQNGYKYPQNSTTSLFLLHILILILNFIIFDRILDNALAPTYIRKQNTRRGLTCFFRSRNKNRIKNQKRCDFIL